MTLTPQNVIIPKCKMQNVILTQNVIRIAAKCNTNAKCNKIFNAKCNNLSTQIVITFLTNNVITQNVIIFEITTCMLLQNRYCGSIINSWSRSSCELLLLLLSILMLIIVIISIFFFFFFFFLLLLLLLMK